MSPEVLAVQSVLSLLTDCINALQAAHVPVGDIRRTFSVRYLMSLYVLRMSGAEFHPEEVERRQEALAALSAHIGRQATADDVLALLARVVQVPSNVAALIREDVG